MRVSQPSISSEHVSTRVVHCGICGSGELEQIIDLPNLPLTAQYIPNKPTSIPAGYDQSLLICSRCGHAQAGSQLAPSILYGTQYPFRTSNSATSLAGTDFFLATLRSFIGTQRFRCAWDLGCNDLHLLKQLKDVAETRIGIDPIWIDREPPSPDGIQVIGSTFEDLDLGRYPRPDLILCRHTLEHIANPREVLTKLMDFAADDAFFLFEVPGFDGLVRKGRFDQIFHEHSQYFNLRAFQLLLARCNARYTGFRENYHHWAAIVVGFKKSAPVLNDPVPAPFSRSDIHSRYALFCEQTRNAGSFVRSLGGERLLYAYGAAQMLPVLAYHLKTDMAEFEAVLDDDVSREGWYYKNLRPPIRLASSIKNLEESNVLITAVDSIKPILDKVFQRRPRHIITPFNLV